jgi:hypothetical protein
MNYDHLNLITDYWKKNIFPNLTQHMVINSFDDYLKRMAYLPSCKWLSEFKSIKVLRSPSVVDPIAFTSRYKDKCLTFCCPVNPEGGFQTVVYQISPTLHLETNLMMWIERDEVKSYSSILACFRENDEFVEFLEDIKDIRKIGDTDKETRGGFDPKAGMMGSRGIGGSENFN